MDDGIDTRFLDMEVDQSSPKSLPDEWRPLFGELTGSNSSHAWALRAAIAIARHRKMHRTGPTFHELFEQLLDLPEKPKGAEGLSPRQLRQANYRFRHHVAIHWRRLGWIEWNHNARSLRTGRTFQAASRAWSRSRRRP